MPNSSEILLVTAQFFLNFSHVFAQICQKNYTFFAQFVPLLILRCAHPYLVCAHQSDYLFSFASQNMHFLCKNCIFMHVLRFLVILCKYSKSKPTICQFFDNRFFYLFFQSLCFYQRSPQRNPLLARLYHAVNFSPTLNAP